MKLLPFNLERALAGEKVVTRDGREVTDLHFFLNVLSQYKIYGVFEGIVKTWTENGSHLVGIEHPTDLFMAPKTVKRWVNFYTNVTVSFSSEEMARRYCGVDAIAIAVPVEFEEGYGCE